MKVMGDGGSKSDVCSSCRMHPGGAAMVCPSAELSKMHVFCFPCLAKKEGMEKSQLITGKIKVGTACVCADRWWSGRRQQDGSETLKSVLSGSCLRL